MSEYITKVPQVTLLFWITKIFATTFGETGGDSFSMSLKLGYLTALLHKAFEGKVFLSC